MASAQDLRERKRRLALSLDASRQQLSDGGRTLRRRLNPVGRVGRHFKKHPLHLFAGTAAGVAILTWILRPRRREPKKQQSLGRFLLAWTLGIAKPVVRLLVVDRARTYLQAHEHSSAIPPDSLLG